MRRLLRWAFNFAALVSAVLFVISLVGWGALYCLHQWLAQGYFSDLAAFNHLPFVVLVAVFTPGTVRHLWGRLKTRQTHRRGFCAACGYDLHATPGRCPECGAVPKVARVQRADL